MKANVSPTTQLSRRILGLFFALLILSVIFTTGCGAIFADRIAAASPVGRNEAETANTATTDTATTDTAATDTAATDTTVTGTTTTDTANNHINSDDLLLSVAPNSIEGKPIDDLFKNNIADFSLELFKKSYSTSGDNSLISPISVVLALAMATNGAGGETLAQMEAMLGGGIPIAELNEYLCEYISELPSNKDSKINIANSIWLNNNVKNVYVKPEFIQASADYYDASIFSKKFSQKTINEINKWVYNNTDKMIDSIISEIDEKLGVAYLINAVAFDAKWDVKYKPYDIQQGTFTDINRSIQKVDFMDSLEDKYIDDGNARGFIKPYSNGDYSFVALLPNDDVSIYQYIDSLTGAGFVQAINDAQSAKVEAIIPKFEFDYNLELNSALYDLGMQAAFSSRDADFSRMADFSNDNNISIEKVLHKTYIAITEIGTIAGAATAVSITEAAMQIAPETIITIRLDRPFVFAIIDNATNLPLFVGTVLTMN